MERFTISLDEQLAARFDDWLARRGYATRSEAVRDLLRAELERSRQQQPEGLHAVACLSYVYNHHERELGERLAHMQHAHHDLTLSTTHVHLDHEHCLESVLLPLQGLKVLELGQLIAGPFAAKTLADFGADVIKVEPPGGGDPLRKWRLLRTAPRCGGRCSRATSARWRWTCAPRGRRPCALAARPTC
jgi:nickel-responsive transcriptional regulator NikR